MNDRTPDIIQSSLKDWFGHEQFRPGQQQVVETLMAGRSAAAVFPTGSGKSLCYQLPAVLLPGLTLVVSPLLALMKDQIDSLQRKNIAAARLDSSLTAEQTRETVQQIRSGEIKLLYVAPERFNNERFRQLIRDVRVSLFAVDEAHCISEWGHNFRPDYLKLSHYAKWCEADRVLALTATAPDSVLEDIRAGFEIQPDDAVRTGFYRGNLQLRFRTVEQNERDEALAAALNERPAGATIVYVTLQKTAVEVATLLESRGLDAKAYHAGMRPEKRESIQEWFLAQPNGIIVATIAFGMGIDKSDIRYVYHYNLPKSLENYSQEIGRAGRDSLASTCETLACVDDMDTLENFARGNTPALKSIQNLLGLAFEEGKDKIAISIYHVSRELDLNELVLKTLLTYLELEGLIEGGTPVYNEYKFKALQPSERILSSFEGERKEFLRSIFRAAKRGTKWLTLNIDDVCAQINSDRQRVLRALEFLDEKGWIELTASGVQQAYTIVKRPSDSDSLAGQLHERMVRHEANELSRLQQVLRLIESETCQTNVLCEHFGEQRQEPCGHCSACDSDRPVELPHRASRSIGQEDRELISRLLDEHSDTFADAQTFARFLCGVRSPALSRRKLTTHRDFGRLTSVPFDQLLDELTQNAG